MLKSFLIFILIIFLFFLLIVAYIVLRFWTMIKAVVNGSKQANAQARAASSGDNNQSTQSSTTSSSSTSQGKKIFAPDEGEYVEFEEVP